MKAILVIDEMPNLCDKCEVRCGGYTAKEYSEKGIKRPSWCPLRPLPQKKELKGGWYHPAEVWMEGANFGYNACIDEILGEADESVG